MALVTDYVDGMAPESSAPPIAAYPQFFKIAIPAGSGATGAYRGYIRPFSDDANARRVFRALQARQLLYVDEGRLDSEAVDLPSHFLEDFLLDMAEPCTVVVLEFPKPEHPRAYLIDPPIIKRLSVNPHLRGDLCLMIEGQIRPALCLYSGNLFKYDDAQPQLPQFLNQLSTYLAKHLIWLRTRMLVITRKDGTSRILRRRKPEAPVKLSYLNIFPRSFWSGFWAGQSAPSHPSQHLATIRPNEQCWCNKGKLYGNCHRPGEVAAAREAGWVPPWYV